MLLIIIKKKLTALELSKNKNGDKIHDTELKIP
jgi:hypothetical protein